MLIQERECMEKFNLRWDAERKKHELPFDINELNDFEFLDSIYLGKDKQCVPKVPGGSIPAEKTLDLVLKNKLVKEYIFDFSSDIISLIKQTLQNGVVFGDDKCE